MCIRDRRKTGYMNTQRFIMEVNALLAQHQTIDEIRWIEKLELGNHEKVLFIALVAEHLYESEQIDLDDVCRDLFDSPLIRANLKKGLRDGSHPFLQKSLIQYHSDDFIMGNYVKLSEDVQANLIGEDIKLEQRLFKPRMGTLIAPQTIAQEALFYNDKEEKQIELLAKTLEENRLQIVFNNLKQASMKPGLNILLMGGPGTGKTATVRNLARQTNRSILMVSIDKIQSKWVGDSEKNLKRVFDEYRTLCKSSEQTPILLFNEADAILGRRIEVTRSVDQMNNALQNILLQELEDFEGIFMATTNFATHLDSAFDRRFLFKVELEMPDEDVRLKILENNFKDVANETLQEINSLYRLTGAQINNIKKKLLIRTALEFEASANEILFTLCEEEFAIKRSQHKKAIGFTH
jgi:SpoVK/Ycf46/Vps4 family AAA+-type ATPase